MPRRRRDLGGFTLLELMIVIGMAGLVMAVSIPFVKQTLRRDAVYHAVHAVEDACRSARSLAIFSNTTSELVIRPQDKELRVQAGSAWRPPPRAPSGSEEENGPVPTTVGVSTGGSKPFAGQLGDEVSIEVLDVNFTEYRDREEARVRFHPNGTSDEFTIIMRIGAGALRRISLDTVTGLPRLEVIR